MRFRGKTNKTKQNARALYRLITSNCCENFACLKDAKDAGNFFEMGVFVVTMNCCSAWHSP